MTYTVRTAILATRRFQFSFPIILVLFSILALIYAWATPPLEASDELWHVGVVNVIADTGQLPVQTPSIETPWEQEGSQPPLYYLIAAVLVKGIDRSDFDTVRQPNPHAIAGVPGAVGNKNLVLHDTPHPPLVGTTLAVYVLRLFSIALGCITVTAVYLTALELTDSEHIPLLAAALTAFNPMFLFITASVNNDNLVTALNSLIIWQMLVLLRKGFSPRRTLLIAILFALASLSKLSALVLLPALLLAVCWLLFKACSSRNALRSTFVQAGLFVTALALIWALVAGWWYLRNLTLYGELFGTQTMAAVAGVREGTFTLSTLLSEFQGFRFGYWGVFGAFNIMTFRWFYNLMDIIVLLALLGLVAHLWRSRSKRDEIVTLLLPGLVILLGAVGVIAWTAQTYASQGRLLFPYLAATSPLLAIGFYPYLARLRGLQWGIGLWMIFALVVPFASIAPAYAPPPVLKDPPESAHQVYARFGEVALIGYETPDQRYQPGDSVPITVYWQVLNHSETDLSLYLHATLDDGSVIGKVDSYPGAGRLRTTRWQPEAIYADTYAVPLDSAAQGISRLRIQVGWWDYASGGVTEAVDEAGNPLKTVMLDVGGFAPFTREATSDDLTAVQDVTFGASIRLTGYKLENNDLTLAWESLGTLPTNDTVFVQVLDADNHVVGQGDAPPALPTHNWLSDERFLTHHIIVYPTPPPAGNYQVIVGWYNPNDFSRLSLSYLDNAYPLTTLTLP